MPGSVLTTMLIGKLGEGTMGGRYKFKGGSLKKQAREFHLAGDRRIWGEA